MARPMDMQALGKEWTKLVVPVICESRMICKHKCRSGLYRQLGQQQRLVQGQVSCQAYMSLHP